MLKFMKAQQKLTPERILKQKELFGFTRACHHGFPAKPTALAWDHRLRLLALATRTGDVRIYGAPGVELYGQHENTESPVTHLLFLPGQCRLVSLCEDNSLHLWRTKEMEGGGLELIQEKSTSLEGKLKKISVIVADNKNENMMVGTEGGNIYLLNIATFTMSDNIIYQDVVMQNVPEDYKVNPGPVEAIAPHTTKADKVLIGYQRGLIVLWDKKNLTADQTYVCSQQLESICWHDDTEHFTTSHNDGSYMVWSVEDSSQPKDGPNAVYGPFPCKAITKLLRPTGKKGEFIIFAGGMPRANYGDRYTVTAIEDDVHITFVLSSKVVDFALIEDKDTGEASSLVILAEEEIVFIDLVTEDWPSFAQPYLASLHTSAITCSSFASDVAPDVFSIIKEAGMKQQTGMSLRPWPVNGGKVDQSSSNKQKDILLTGHEDGTVRFWDASGVSLTLLYKLSTSQLFLTEDLGGDEGAAEEDDWPPFRKVGLFDPYSDDPRLGVKKIEVCPHTGTLVVAGTAGQVLVMNTSTEAKDFVPESSEVNLVAETDNFIWKSHNKLELKTNSIKFEPGMHPTVIVQCYPPASCTSLTLHSEWGLVACGTAHGFALFDIIQKKNLLTKSTLSAIDLANAADEGPMSRRKSLKKSLRESFRRLRRGRSQRKTTKPGATSPTSPQPKSGGTAGIPVTDEDAVIRPVERAVEARSNTSDFIGSMVRCLHLTKCFIANSQGMSATLWAGTNSGAIFVFTVSVPPSDKRAETPLTVQLGKEIHLKHGAPVISIVILDGAAKPFPEPMAVKKERAPPPNTTGPHKVLICSEEQFKVFTLPQLKPYCKFKLTAHEGSRVRKIGYCSYVSKADANYREHAFNVVTNLGDLSVFSLPDCKRQVHTQCIKKEDINGISSVVFSNRGEALCLVSPCELQRVSLSASYITKPTGTIPLPKPVPIKLAVNQEETVEKADENEFEEKEGASAITETPVSSLEGDKADNNVEKAAVKSECDANEEAATSKKEEKEVNENGDSSVLSGDVTIDSIRDHMDELKISDKMMEISESSTTLAASSTSTSVAVRESSSSVTVVKSTTITSVSSQESSSVQVVEMSTNEANHTTINGTQVGI